MSFTPAGSPTSLAVVAATPYPAGFALVNATPVILSWAVPADGQQHRVQVAGLQHVTVAETGGQVGVTVTAPDGTTNSFQVFAAGSGTGLNQNQATSALPVQAGSTVILQQFTALTVGAAVCFLELLAS